MAGEEVLRERMEVSETWVRNYVSLR
jgi:hypothetical protein